MTRHVQRSGKPGKIVKADNPVALFASMITVFYGDAVVANGYARAGISTAPHFGRYRASQVK